MSNELESNWPFIFIKQRNPPKFANGQLLFPENGDRETLEAVANWCEWWSRKHYEGWADKPEGSDKWSSDGFGCAYHNVASTIRGQLEHEARIANARSQIKWWWPLARLWNRWFR